MTVGVSQRCRASAIVIALLVLPTVVPEGVSAQPGVYEAEPNDAPDQANPIAGEVTVFGTMAGTDQDGFLWTVSDDDARKRWTFQLDGIPGALTVAEVIRLELADNGVDVSGYEKLMKMGTRDGSTPAVQSDLIFEPGEYLIGIAHAGGSPGERGGGMFRPPTGDLSFGEKGEPEAVAELAAATEPEKGAYRFSIREGARLSVGGVAKKGASREDSIPVRPGSETAAFETRPAAWYAFDFDADEAGQRWDVRAQVPVGRDLEATLFDGRGEKLVSKRSDEHGRIEFPDIAPREERYYLELEPAEPDLVTAVGSEAVGRRVEGEEAEPNGRWELANRVDLSRPLSGRVDEANESDYFTFSVDESTSDQLLNLRLESAPEAQAVLFCLHDADNDRAQCRDSTTPIELPDLLLRPGDWGLSVSRARSQFSYEVSLTPQGPVEPGHETEPNDEIQLATSVPASNRIKGRASGKDDDYFRFLIADEPQLWRFQVIGDGITEIAYYDGAGKRVAQWRPQRGQRRLRLENLFLLPGEHYVRVSGEDGADYTLLARPLGPPDANGEREPNDDTSRMQRLAVGQTRTGLLSDANDADYYRFFLANWDHVKLTVAPPVDGIVAPHLYWYDDLLAQGIPSEKGEAISLEGVYPPGDYYVRLEAKEPSDAEYRLSLERLPRYSCPADCEPNGMSQIYLAAPLPPDLVLEGEAGQWRDEDVYQLPELPEASELRLLTDDSRGRISLGRDRRNRERLAYDAARGAYVTTVPAGGPYRLFIESRGEYRLELELDNGPPPLRDASLDAELSLTLSPAAVSAFRTYGQHIAGHLTIANRAATALSARLEATTSDYRWRVALGRAEIALAPGGEETIPVEVQVPPDAWAEHPVRVSVRAFDTAGAQIQTWTEIAVERDLSAVEPRWSWPVPEAMLGGLNAAWLPFGGEWTQEMPRGARFELLRDGLVFAGARMECCGATNGWEDGEHPVLTLDLPGDRPVPVAGMALDHFGSPGALRDIRRAALLLSEDGEHFEEVLGVETLPVETEQYFALPVPQPARYARLRIDETFNEIAGTNGVALGEWKVILEPGYDLSEGRGFDLARPELGGHLVSDSPPEFYSPVAVLDESKKTNPARTRPGVDLEYVVGFHHDRAAQIRRVEWVNPERVKPEYALAEVIVAVSTSSPAGPWKRIGSLDPGSSDEPAVLELDSPVWARFVKFTGLRQGNSGIAAAPNVIRIWERPTGDGYASVLGEWGDANPRSSYELEEGIPPDPEGRAAGNESRDRAARLKPGEVAAGQVMLAKRSHWYRLEVPADANTLHIALSGTPTVRTVLALEDAAGEPLRMARVGRESTPARHVFEALAEPGSVVFLHVSEPPRNVVFTWDTSASVNAYLPIIYNSLAAFMNQVVPGRESVNLVPFGRGPLLDSWLGEPYMLQTILNDYPRRESSSSGELALQVSAQTLAPVAGAKSIMVITDGAVTHHGPMWKEMREIQPRVFGVGVAGSEAKHQDVFEDWASVNGGDFTQLRYQGEMEVAFDRATTLMRRPADYALEVTTEYREAPGPGSLLVVAGDDGDGGGDALRGRAVELILDASGSMLQRMGGKRRIVIAREVLDEAVREHLPAGTPVALRVFGHKEPGTCATELEIPLGPLDADRAVAAIDAIQAKNLAKTPIADSLAAVPRDLKGAKAASVVLVTDGEETCGGDPAAAIESLAEAGVEVSVNIVGFAIDDEALERQFAEWAELGGGRYFSAADEQGLSAALEEALEVPFEVFDASGERVAQGLVGGEPVELEQGSYRVVVGTAPPRTFEDVEVVGEQRVRLEVSDGRRPSG